MSRLIMAGFWVAMEDWGAGVGGEIIGREARDALFAAAAALAAAAFLAAKN